MDQKKVEPGALFGAMETKATEEKKDERRKQFMNLASEGEIKRRQYDCHEELRKEKR